MNEFIIYSFIAIPLSIAIDWAFFERAYFVILQLFKLNNPYNYRKFIWTRLIFTSISAELILYGAIFERKFGIYTVGGIFLFLLANWYPLIKVYFDNKNNR